MDKYLPVSSKHGSKVTMGQRVAAMILNGLGFIDDRLYMFPEFLENKPVDRLFGSHGRTHNYCCMDTSKHSKRSIACHWFDTRSWVVGSHCSWGNCFSKALAFVPHIALIGVHRIHAHVLTHFVRNRYLPARVCNCSLPPMHHTVRFLHAQHVL